MSYKIIPEYKKSFKNSIIKNNNFNDYCEWNEVKSHLLFNQLFDDTSLLKITKWQCRVVLHELKRLSGPFQTVYCIVEIGDQKFKTKEKNIVV